MENIDWSKAPEWADSVRKTVVGELFWCSDKQYLILGHSKESNPISIGNEGQKGILRHYTIDNLELVETRPDAWQDGEERMDNIAQNGNDGHYDAVNHPEHYQSESGIECIDAIRASLGLDGFVAYCRGNAIKYSWRSGKKSEHAEDLRKAAWYLDRAAQELEKSK